MIFLQTRRMQLRQFTVDDAGSLFDLHNDPEVMRFINGGKATPRSVIEQEVLPRYLGYYSRFTGLGFWAATRKSDGTFLGWFEFRPLDDTRPEEVELGYRLRREAWGQGLAAEGALALIRKGFTELGVQRVIATTMTVNTASRRVMEKAGLKFVRSFHLSWPEYIEGAEHGDVEYQLRRADWEREL